MTEEFYGINGIKEIHRFVPLRVIEEECRLRELVQEDIQRPVMQDRVNSIAKSIRDGRTRQSVFTFTFANIGLRRVLVDGQHRLQALRQIADSEEDEEARNMILDGTTVHIREIRVADENEAIRLRDELGSVVPVTPMGTAHRVVCGNHLSHFLKNCENRPSISETPHYGNWSNRFVDVVTGHGFYDFFDSAEQMMNEIRGLNRYVFCSAIQTPNDRFINFIAGNDRGRNQGRVFSTFQINYHGRDPDQNRVMCLHLIVRYGFMEIILRKVARGYPSYEALFQQAYERRERFHFNETPGPSVKTDALNRFFGTPQVGTPQIKQCPVCDNYNMDRENASSYHFGHIVSRAMGGQNIATNLIPVCPPCNLACGARNMRDFCRERYGRDFVL